MAGILKNVLTELMGFAVVWSLLRPRPFDRPFLPNLFRARGIVQIFSSGLRVKVRQHACESLGPQSTSLVP